ncbi:Putative universal stress protein [Rubripirellula lacrimiformis]|uniref:Universal stress protein n=1 Tax=Rubripirellula lacrimiformis TaxID=1930273 RepID=A0A517N4Q1_9BACT|nr:universal stress protein [Rubripirellula lacrimiformis]QDT02114.1 Putative universal stress protein [Rubripirellula lacrimiformis]
MKILLPIDGSQAANDAVQFVKTLAQNRDVDVVAMTVSYNPAHYSMQPWVPEWTEQENKRTQSILDSAKQTLDGVCRSVTLVHGSGATVPTILEKAESLKANLIVMGAKGHSAVRRILLGSVSDSVATSAKCSVVVVRSKPDSGSDFKKIVLGFDQSIASREAVAELTEWKLPRDLEIDVVSVVMQPIVYAGEGYIDVPITVDPKQVDRLDEAAERMASQIADHFPHTNAKTPVATHVGDAIVTEAEESNAGLVIVGDTGHSLLGQWLLGSTSKYVLRHSPCSVWISRHHWTADEAAAEVDDVAAAN